jgi:two-component system, OmpR family, alkaline phosphatase synthesis response regulator PhoP
MNTKKESRASRNRSGMIVEFQKRDTGGTRVNVNDAASLEAALNLLQSNIPDVLFLELVLFGRESRDTIHHLADNYDLKKIETFNFSAFQDDTNEVSKLIPVVGNGLTAGFSEDISVARVRVVPKKKSDKPFLHDGTFRIHNMVIIPGRREVYVEGRKVNLTFTMFNILNYLAQKPGWIFTYNQIIDATRGSDANVLESSVKTQVCMMRKRLGPAGKYIETVLNLGYRMRDDDNGHESQ